MKEIFNFILFIFSTCCAVLAQTTCKPLPSTKPVYSYRKPDGTNFFMTSDEQEATSIGMSIGPQMHGLIYLGSQFRVAASPVDDNWVPLYRYYNGVHFYTADPGEIGATNPGEVGKFNYKCEGILGYVSKIALPDMVPLHRFYLPNNANSHQYVLESNPDYWMNRANTAIAYENIAGYVFKNCG